MPRPSTARIVLAALTALLLSAYAEVGAAQCVDFASNAQSASFFEGLEAYKKQDFARAAERFQSALQHREIDIVLLNLAWSLTALGRCDDAWHTYERVLLAPNICGAPTREELTEELRFALEQFHKTCPTHVRFDCEGDEVQLASHPESPLLALMFKDRQPTFICGDIPRSTWPGSFRASVTRGGHTAIHDIHVRPAQLQTIPLPTLGLARITCDPAAAISIDDYPAPRCEGTVELHLPPGRYTLINEDDPTVTSTLTVGAWQTSTGKLGEDIGPATRWRLTVPLRVGVLALQPELGDGLLRLTDTRSSADRASAHVGATLDLSWLQLALSAGLDLLALEAEGAEGQAPLAADGLAPGVALRVTLPLPGLPVELAAAFTAAPIFFSDADGAGEGVAPDESALLLAPAFGVCLRDAACLDLRLALLRGVKRAREGGGGEGEDTSALTIGVSFDPVRWLTP